ncbi:MAG: DUF3560 domain-containing protein [bacterium]|nr:DUF3560 domain-containing protein [bacterium]
MATDKGTTVEIEKKQEEEQHGDPKLEERIRVYKEQKQARVDRLRERAGKARDESQRYKEKSDEISKYIPPGQPILEDHHSAPRHRKDLERVWDYEDKRFQELGKAEKLERRADIKENNTAIFSDDPEAIRKLKEKIIEQEKLREQMKHINKEFRKVKGDVTKIESLDVTDGIKKAIRDNIGTKDFANRNWKPFESYQLQNLGQNIQANKKRLERLIKQSQEETTTKKINGVTVIDNVEGNRLQLFFPGKPNDVIRSKLKRYGFRWAPSNGCWQRHRGSDANWKAKNVLEEY